MVEEIFEVVLLDKVEFVTCLVAILCRFEFSRMPEAFVVYPACGGLGTDSL